MSLDDLGMRLQPAASLGLDCFQLIQRDENSIGQRLVRKWPEPFSGLDLWGIRGQERQMDALRDPEVSAAVPARPIHDQQDLFSWSCSHLLGKGGQGAGEHLDADRRQQPPAGLSALRMHKGEDIHPFIALSHWGFDCCSLWCPDPSQNRFETDTMLIHRPQLDAGLAVLLLYQRYLFWQFF